MSGLQPTTEGNAEDTPCSLDSLFIDHPHGDFARLIPSNFNARTAFSDVVEKVKSHPEKCKHHARYIHSEPARGQSTLSELSDVENQPQPNRWTGYYRLNVEIPPKHKPTGWVIGSGNNNLKDGGVDFLLTAKSREDRVSSTHFIIKHDTSSGLLIIRTGENKKVMLDGKHELRSEFRAFSDRRHGVEIGDLSFQLAWTDFSSDTYKAQVSQLRKEIGLPEFEVSRFLEITPLDVHISVGDFLIQDTIAGGGFGVVFAGFRKSDAAEVAAKKIRRDENNFDAVEDEINMLESIKRHPRILSMVGVHYGEGSRYEPGPHGIDEMYIFCMPLATADVWDIIYDDNVTDNDRIKFFTQFCDGLKFLHSQGVIHRDIKPANLAVVSRKPPQGIIIDFGFATFDRKSKEYQGTLPYVAPEMLAIAKAEESENPLDLRSCKAYDNSVDVWGLGLVGFELFRRKLLHNPEEGIDEEKYAQWMEEWAHHPWDPLVKLAVDVAIQMIHWDPAARISAEYALLSMLVVDDDPEFYNAKVGNKRVAPEDQGWTSLFKRFIGIPLLVYLQRTRC